MLTVLLIVVVLMVARWKGLLALLELGFVGAVLIGLMLPTLITGKPGIAMALAGGTVIMLVVLYVTHDVSIRTSAALVGTLFRLAITVGLGALSAEFARLSGFADRNGYGLAQLLPRMNLRELLMVGTIIGGLGVPNDVAIMRNSAAWGLCAATPKMSRGKPSAAGARTGYDRIASTIYTIVFAYAGDSMAVLLLLYFTDRPTTALLNAEMFAGEIVRTLGSAIGLVLSILITTGITALTIASPEPKPRGRHTMGVDVE